MSPQSHLSMQSADNIPVLNKVPIKMQNNELSRQNIKNMIKKQK